MLEIISGRAGSGKTSYCLDRIKDELLEQPDGRAIIMLLPEHMTYKVERELASMLAAEGRGFARCYVYGFRRFAYRILQETGGGLEQGLTELGRQLLLKRLLDRRLADNSLTAFAGAARKKGFVTELTDIINELKSYCLDPELLQEIAGQVGEQDVRLQGKLRDMALIYGDFNRAMAGKYQDGKDVLAKVVEKLSESQLVQGAELWLDGFLFFNPLERAILSQLFSLCGEIHVSLTLDHSGLTAGRPWLKVPQENLFHRSHSTRNYLLQLAEEKALAVQDVFMPTGGRALSAREKALSARGNALTSKESASITGGRFISPALGAIEAQWLSHRVTPVRGKDAVSFLEAANPRLELEAAAADMVRLVREKGYKWRDMGILIRDEDTYGFLAEMVLAEYDIPFFNAAKRQVTHHPLAELLRGALTLCTGRQGWSYENVFRCLKTGFFKAPCALLPDTLDELENYVLEFGIKGKKLWTGEEPWKFVRRYSLDRDQVEEKEIFRAERMDSCRRQVAAPLLKLQSVLQKPGQAGTLATAIYDFLLELQIPQQLEEWARQDEVSGTRAKASEHRQVWKGIMELLDQLVELGGQEDWQPGEFVAVLEEGLDNMSVSLIPPGIDYVSIASFDQNSLDNLRAIYVLGANAGIMPRRTSENVILSDADRIHINQVEVAGAQNSRQEGRLLSVIGRESSYNEAYLLYKGFTQAREYLWVSYALADDGGTGKEAARLVKWLRQLLPDTPLGQALQGEGFVAAPGQAVSSLGNALRHCREYGLLADQWQGVYNWLVKQAGLEAAGGESSLAGTEAAVGEAAGMAATTGGAVKDLGMAKRLVSLQRALGSRFGGDRLPESLAKQLFTRRGYLGGSVTRLERYNECPFMYYAQYGLKLEERRISRFASPELGTLLHGVLREFGERLKAEGRRWGDVGEEEQGQLCHEILYALAPKMGNTVLFQQKQLAIQLRRIENTASFALQRLCAFDRVSQLHPTLFEQGFGGLGGDGGEKALQLLYDLSGGARLSLTGQIDRIDRTEDGRYFMVMDYKTGSAYINLMDVYYGIKLQLLTYLLVAGQLLAARSGQGAVPVAMLYYFLKRPVVSLASHQAGEAEVIEKLENQLKMPGWVVADNELVQLIDSTLAGPGAKSRFIKVSVTQKGALSKTSSCLRTERELELLLAYVEQLLQQTGKRILSGDIAPVPYRDGKGQSPCGYCRYRPLCGFDAQLEGYTYRKTQNPDKTDFMGLIEGELTPEQVQQLDDRLQARLVEREQAKPAVEDTEAAGEIVTPAKKPVAKGRTRKKSEAENKSATAKRTMKKAEMDREVQD